MGRGKNTIKALIFAAGKGSRLGDLTKDTPKPMLEIGSQPVLEHIIFWLSQYGVDDIMINTGYKGEVIYNYFKDRVTYFHDPDLVYSAEQTIDVVSPWFRGDHMLVQNGDTLTNLDIDSLLKMSQGKSVRFMDKDKKTYAGTTILSPMYLQGIDRTIKSSAVAAEWVDMGTPQGLEKARQMYEGK